MSSKGSSAAAIARAIGAHVSTVARGWDRTPAHLPRIGARCRNQALQAGCVERPPALRERLSGVSPAERELVRAAPDLTQPRRRAPVGAS